MAKSSTRKTELGPQTELGSHHDKIESRIHRDLSTVNGHTKVIEMTIGEYLEKLGFYNGETLSENWSGVSTDFQRGIIGMKSNTIKQTMLRDLLRGCILPPLVVYDDNDNYQIIDGLQRTSVIFEALKIILALEANNEADPSKPSTKIEPYAGDVINEITEAGYSPLNKESFLTRPVIIQLWSNLSHNELRRLFMVLNHSQQRVSNRHLLEIDRIELRSIFVDWGLPVITVPQQKLNPRVGRPKAGTMVPQSFHFEYFVNGLIAYVKGDQHTKTSTTVSNDDKLVHDDSDMLNNRVIEIGNELCEADFKWICLVLNDIVQKKYHGNKSGEVHC